MKMAEKNLLSWVGYKGDSKGQPTPSQNAVERIRELESQLSDLRSRRDITNLSKEEFEIMATETAMQMIRSAQAREAKANATVQKLLAESSRSAKEKVESAEAKAKSLLSSAENRSRKYIQTAEAEAEEIKSSANSEAESLLNSRKREAATIASAARKEAERLVAEATSQIANYRSWLGTAISDAERLHRVQTASLSSAMNAMEETQRKLDSAFEKLATLKESVNRNIDESTSNRKQLQQPAKRSKSGSNGKISSSE
jgi:cell division septum initiation protein DivIVA